MSRPFAVAYKSKLKKSLCQSERPPICYSINFTTCNKSKYKRFRMHAHTLTHIRQNMDRSTSNECCSKTYTNVHAYRENVGTAVAVAATALTNVMVLSVASLS